MENLIQVLESILSAKYGCEVEITAKEKGTH